MSEQLAGSPYWPYVFPINGPSSAVLKVLGPGGVGPRLGALEASLQKLESTGRIEVFLTQNRGLGVRVGAQPLQGVFAVYAGWLVTASEADDRSDASFQFSSEMGPFSKFVIDATIMRHGGVAFGAGLLNHRCAGFNARSRVEWYDGRPVLLFETIGVVAPWTELTWNYNGTRDSGYFLSAQALKRISKYFGTKPCLCGDDGVCPFGKGRVSASDRMRAAGQAGGSRRKCHTEQQPPRPQFKIRVEEWRILQDEAIGGLPRDPRCGGASASAMTNGKKRKVREASPEGDRRTAKGAARGRLESKRSRPAEQPGKVDYANNEEPSAVQPLLVYDRSPGGRERAAAAVQADVKHRLRLRLGAELYDRLDFGRTTYPTIQNRGALKQWLGRQGLTPEVLAALLHDASERSPLERGTAVDMVGISRRDGRGITFEQLGAISEQVFDPAELAGGTRDAYETAYRKVFSFFLSHDRIRSMLPMSVPDFKRMLTEFVMAGESVGSLRTAAAAVARLHARAGLESPTEAGGGLTKLLKPFSVAQGTPRAVCTPIGPEHVQKMLQVTGASPSAERALLVTAFGTVIAGRNQHVADRTVCDLIEDYDEDRDHQTKGSLAVCIPNQKQDREGRGAMARIKAGILTARLKQWLKNKGLAVSPYCQKRKKGANARCKCNVCPPLFTSRVDAKPEANGTYKPISRQQVSDCVKQAMRIIGVSPDRMSGRSMRRGGITTARQHKVPEDVVYATSGHGMKRAGRLYMGDHSIDELYAVSAACEGQ
jgi:hypothetical protein